MIAPRARDAASQRRTLAAAFLPPFTKAASVQPGERVLDVASADARSAMESAMRVRGRGEVLVVGASPEVLQAVAREADEAGVTVVRTASMNPEHLDLGDGYWDVVTCHLGLPDIAAPELAFAEMRRVLRPAGRIAVSVLGERDRCPLVTILLDVVGRHLPAARTEQDRLFRIAESARLSTLVAGAGFEHAVPDRPVIRFPFRDANDYWDFATASTGFGRVAAGLPDEAVEECKTEIVRRARVFAGRDGIVLPVEAIILSAVK